MGIHSACVEEVWHEAGQWTLSIYIIHTLLAPPHPYINIQNGSMNNFTIVCVFALVGIRTQS